MAIWGDIQLMSMGSSPRDLDGYSSYSRSYLVKSDNRTDGPVVVRAAIASQLGFADYEPYDFGDESNPDALLKTDSVDPHSKSADGGFYWIWTGFWDDKPFDQNSVAPGTLEPGEAPEKKKNQPPDLRPWIINRDSVQVERALLKDFSDPALPIKNKAGIPLPLTMEIPVGTLTITYNTLTTTGTEQEDYESTTNDATFLGHEAGRLLCKKISVKSVYEVIEGIGAYYYEKTVTLWVANKWMDAERFGGAAGDISHDKFLMNAGTMQLKDGKFIKCQDAFGGEASEPMPLKANGEQLPPGEPDEHFIFLRFKGHPPADWSDM